MAVIERISFAKGRLVDDLPSTDNKLRPSLHYEIAAICNSSVESAHQSIEYHKQPSSVKAYGSAEDMTKDPDIDLIDVSIVVSGHLLRRKASPISQEANLCGIASRRNHTWTAEAELSLDFESDGDEFQKTFAHFLGGFVHVLEDFASVKSTLQFSNQL
ncbi:oxidoreductase family [Trichoderma arundinaceum]|uniref:Oxidoreductase family n=1 Tax=Trichoderma arundinaceum TaxID=490622 RepID=A0A395NUZ7_TRIAR|nr:oxidoreductase family [Trichoderma arundinaceum]